VFTEGCGAVWVVDTTDRDRLVESREELHRMRKVVLQTDMPILVLATKQDLPVSNILTCSLYFACFSPASGDRFGCENRESVGSA
jgi:hypothetical protein